MRGIGKKQQPSEEMTPFARWHDVFKDIIVKMGGIKHFGGIETIIQRWPQDRIGSLIDDMTLIRNDLDLYIAQASEHLQTIHISSHVAVTPEDPH
jgi:hypothetical protein